MLCDKDYFNVPQSFFNTETHSLVYPFEDPDKLIICASVDRIELGHIEPLSLTFGKS